jgi:hypothetical protein
VLVRFQTRTGPRSRMSLSEEESRTALLKEHTVSKTWYAYFNMCSLQLAKEES